MKIKGYTVIAHTLVWVLLLVVPYVSTDQVFDTLGASPGNTYLLLCLGLSGVLIFFFYLNLVLLIPKFLIAKRYWIYFSLLILTVFAVFLLSGFLFLTPQSILGAVPDTDPAIEKIFPAILVNALLLWLLSIASSIVWTTYNRLRQTENEKLSAQIASLTSQINPHFLFNTLNNIYATAIDTSPKTADMIDKLSEMMRYTTKDTRQDFVLLEDEVNYIGNYIDLQQLRLDRSVNLSYELPQDIPPLRIAPMLLVPFIENAFKHGVNSEQKSRIDIKIKLNDTALQLTVVNTKVDRQLIISEHSGLGIENTRHRLKLIYPSNHLLVIHDGEKEFSVSLHINLV